MAGIDEIRQLYYGTTKATIQRDLARAIDILKSMDSDDERERAAVFMDGLSQMRSEWGITASRPGSPASAPRSAKGPARSGRSTRTSDRDR